jgi:hypothetical protein
MVVKHFFENISKKKIQQFFHSFSFFPEGRRIWSHVGRWSDARLWQSVAEHMIRRGGAANGAGEVDDACESGTQGIVPCT